MSRSDLRVQKAQTALQYATPAVVLLYYLGAVAVSLCTLQSRPKRKHDRSQHITVWSINFILITYLAQCGDLAVDTLSPDPTISTLAANLNAAVSTLLWYLVSIVFQSTKRPVRYPYLGACLLTLGLEIAIFALFASHALSKAVEYVFLAFQTSRFLALLLVLTFHASARIASNWAGTDEESASLLGPQTLPTAHQHGAAKPAGKYGSVAVADTSHSDSTDSTDSDDSDAQEVKKQKKLLRNRLQENGNWFTYLRGFSLFLPLVWPSKRPFLYWNMLGCAVCILGTRVFTLLEPRQLGIIVNILASGSGSLYTAIGLYVLYLWISSAIDLLQGALWLPVELYSQTEIRTTAYNQIMILSSDFHDNKQTGELYQAITQGSAIGDLMETICFQLGPMGLDLIVGYGYLYHLFGPYMAIIAAATTLAYLSSTFHLNGKLSKHRRKLQDLHRKEFQIMYDTVGSWTTISYFNRVPYEEKRYKEAISLRMTAYLLYSVLSSLFQKVGSSATKLGLCGALCLAAYQVTQGEQQVGSFVTLLTYWTIFLAPVRLLANTHRQILSDLLDAEQLLQLLQQRPKIKDKEGARNFIMKGGAVDFRNVDFSYNGNKQIIKGVSFSAQPGQKIALVGETGGGKSTLLKLLFRFYDVTGGSVLIDDQDVRDVTVESLRNYIGVVPQDPSMFNDTVMNNVRYSRLEATDEEVMEACKAAAVHEKILSFTDGYASKVGEKGVKLSGGELQRLAIARAILKNPAMILLDEATSSVDTDTESRIQTALHELTKGRTTFTVAHRLSTVVDADVILVVKDGIIVEQGPPKELLAAKGKYYDLWCKQVGINSKTLEETEDTGVAAKEYVRTQSGSEEAQPGMTERKKPFRPDAPEFIPSYLKASESSTIDDTTARSLKQQEQPTDKGVNGKIPSQGKRQRAREHGSESAATSSTDKVADKAAVGTSNGTVVGTNDLASTRRVRRRRISKNETAENSAGTGDGGTDDLAATPEGSGHGSASQNRRVSAPSMSTVKGKTTGPGRRSATGRKQGRIRSKISSNTQSAPGTWSGLPPDIASTSIPEGTDNPITHPEGESKENVRFT